MAQKYVVQVVDDIDGTELDHDDVEEIRFSLDGRAYVIDLSKTNAAKLRDALAPYTDAARRDSGSSVGTARSTKPTTEKRKDLEQVRQWANSNGHPVSSRGRIPGAVLEAYDSAH